jgi:hypothetical protein
VDTKRKVKNETAVWWGDWLVSSQKPSKGTARQMVRDLLDDRILDKLEIEYLKDLLFIKQMENEKCPKLNVSETTKIKPCC